MKYIIRGSSFNWIKMYDSQVVDISVLDGDKKCRCSACGKDKYDRKKEVILCDKKEICFDFVIEMARESYSNEIGTNDKNYFNEEFIKKLGNSVFNAMNKMITDEQIKKTDDYFNHLIGNEKRNISHLKLSCSIGVSQEMAKEILIKYKENGYLKQYYVIRCEECGIPIKTADSISELPDETFECYNCGQKITIKQSKIEIFYSLID